MFRIQHCGCPQQPPLAAVRFRFSCTVDKPVREKFKLDVLNAVVVENRLYLLERSMPQICSRSVCQMPIPLKPALAAALTRSSKSCGLISAVPGKMPDVDQYKFISSTSLFMARRSNMTAAAQDLSPDLPTQPGGRSAEQGAAALFTWENMTHPSFPRPVG